MANSIHKFDNIKNKLVHGGNCVPPLPPCPEVFPGPLIGGLEDF